MIDPITKFMIHCVVEAQILPDSKARERGIRCVRALMGETEDENLVLTMLRLRKPYEKRLKNKAVAYLMDMCKGDLSKVIPCLCDSKDTYGQTIAEIENPSKDANAHLRKSAVGLVAAVAGLQMTYSLIRLKKSSDESLQKLAEDLYEWEVKCLS